MLTIVYQILLVIVVILITWELFSQKKPLDQTTAAIALIPFALRLFMIG